MTPFLPGAGAGAGTGAGRGAAGGAAQEPSALLKRISELKTDDYILLGIIAVLFFEGSDDYIMMAALGYLFLMGL